MTIKLTRLNLENIPIVCWLIILWRQDYVKLFSVITGLPPSFVMGASYGIAATLFLVYLYSCGCKIVNYKGYYILVLMLIVYIISILAVPNEYVGQFLKDFILYACVEAIYVSQIRNYDQAIKMFCLSAIVTFIICGFLPFSGGLSHYRQMPFFGTGMAYGETLAVPCFIGLYLFRKKYNSKKFILFEIACIALTAILANRSSLLVAVFLVITYNMFLDRKMRTMGLVCLILACIIISTLFLNIESILTLSSERLKELGIYSYSLGKYRTLFARGLEGSSFGSGRGLIIGLAWSYFKQNPLFGIGIGEFNARSGYPYPHNIFIDWYSTLGILIGTILLAATAKAIFNVFRCQNIEKKTFILILFVLWFPRLLFSKTFVNDVPYWTFMTFSLSFANADFTRGEVQLSSQ